MTSREFADWRAFMRTEAIGDERADLRMGILASISLAPHMKKGKSPPPPHKFMPYHKEPVPTPEQINSIIARAKSGAKRRGR